MNLKIIYFLDDGQGFGGAANTLFQQAVLMKKAGCEVLLSISNHKNQEIAKEYFDICKKGDIEIIHLPFQISSHPEDIDVISIIDHYPVIRDAVKAYAPDLLHSIQINPIAELVSRELKIPHIMDIYQIQESFFSIGYMDIFPHYHICDSWYYANKWKEILHTDSTCIRTIADWPLHDEKTQNKSFSLITEDEDCKKIRFCCVGAICNRKNQMEVIKAFEMALSEGLRGELYLYGYDIDSYADECKSYLKERRLENSIRITGFYSKMDEEYEKADVLLCGSTRESYPNAISEALSHGLVVITTPVGGVPEVIQDGYNGYLCDGYTKTEICQKIMQFDEERKSGRVADILKNAEDTYRKVHASEEICSELLKYYKHVLQDNYEISKIRLENIKNEFSDLIELYRYKHDTFKHPEMVQVKLWYIYHIEKILKRLALMEKKKFYIWGAGRLAETVKSIIEIFFPFLKLDGIIDNYKQGELLGLPVLSPKGILEKSDVVLFIGLINGQEEVLRMMQEYSKICNEDYFILASRVW